MDTVKAASTRTIILFTDEPQAGLGASQLIASTGRFTVKIADPDVSRLLPLVDNVKPDVLLIDVTSEMTLSLFSRLKEAAPNVRLVLWARWLPPELIAQAAELDAVFIRKTCSNEEFLERITAGADKTELIEPGPGDDRTTRVNLTLRESQLVSLLAQGLKNKEIASCLGISEGTVKVYLSKLFQKTGARDRLELSLFGLKNAYCGQAFWDGPNAFVTVREEERARPFLRSLVLVQPARRTGYADLARAAGDE